MQKNLTKIQIFYQWLLLKINKIKERLRFFKTPRHQDTETPSHQDTKTPRH